MERFYVFVGPLRCGHYNTAMPECKYSVFLSSIHHLFFGFIDIPSENIGFFLFFTAIYAFLDFQDNSLSFFWKGYSNHAKKCYT